MSENTLPPPTDALPPTPESTATEAAATFWRQELGTLPGRRRGLGDRPGSGAEPPDPGLVATELPAPLRTALTGLTADQDTTLAGTVQALFQLLLQRHGGGQDNLVAERVPHADGCTHPVLRRTRFDDSLTFAALLAQVQARRRAAVPHDTLPLAEVVRACGTEMSQEPGQTGVVAAAFGVDVPVTAASPLDLGAAGTTTLALHLSTHAAPWHLRLDYDRRHFSAAFAATLLGHFLALAASATAQPRLPLGQLSMLDAAERDRILTDWNQTHTPFPRERCLHQLVQAQARRTPTATAIVQGAEQITYAQLEQRAEKLAAYLRRDGIGRGHRVSLLLDPGIELLVALLGILKSGAAYHPLASSTPPQRIQLLLEDLGAALLISRRALVANDLTPLCPLLLLDEEAAAIAAVADAPTDAEPDPQELAYVIYTSGSTGKPKGVMVPHASVCNTLQWRQSALPFRPTDRLLLTLSHAFDASLFQLFQPLLAGACLVIPETDLGGDPVRIIQAVRRHTITILGVPPTLWRHLLGEPALDACDSIRLAFTGGEALSADIAAAIQRRLGVALNNMYGPTEAAVEATWWTYTPGASVSLGRPIANMRAYVLDEDLEPVPVGVAGELYLAGAGLARGYLHDPQTTAQRFLPDPFDAGGGRLYRTGDLCRWLPDGTLAYLGRQDYQVKLHGHRIELEEIEIVLQGSPAVRECVVMVREDNPGAKRLVAYVVAGPNAGTVPESGLAQDTAALRRHLGAHLPAYMIPANFVFLAAIPRNTSGKPDREALPAPPATTTAPPTDTRAERPLEAFLAALWEQTLGVTGIGDDDNFFDLGGSSIQVAILARKLEETLGEFLYTVAFYDAPTVAKLAHYLRLNYARAVIRLFGAGAMAGVEATREPPVSPEDIAHLGRIVRSLGPRPGPPPVTKNPSALFVLSPPRSGSTLFRIMLGGHPALFAPPELVLLNYNTLGERRRALASERDNFWLQGLVRAVMEAGGLDERAATELIADGERHELPVKDLYARMQDWLGGVTLVEKTPHYALDPATLARAEADFANARYLHLIRHPSPVISSFEEARLQVFFPPFFTEAHSFGTHRLAELVWDLCHQNILAFLADIPRERRYAVRFEDLVGDPTKTMRGVADFLGLPFHPAMADPYRKKKQGARMSDAHHSLGRMLGDVKFEKHGRIRAESAQRRQGRFPEAELGTVTRELAQRLGYVLQGRRPRHLVALQETGTLAPLYCVHPAGGTVSCYRELSRSLGSERPFHAFGTPLEAEVARHGSVQELAATYIAELRRQQPQGPYQLSGWSFGGLVAFEMALQLTAAGEQVPLLALFSSYLIDAQGPKRALRLRDFALEFLNERGLDLRALDTPGGAQGDPRGLGRKALMYQALARAKAAGVVAADLDFAAFRRLMVRQRLRFRAHVQIGRRYQPGGRLPRMLLFDATDRSLDGQGPFAPWDDFVADIERHESPGNHFTMLRAPNLDSLVTVLQRHLADA